MKLTLILAVIAALTACKQHEAPPASAPTPMQAPTAMMAPAAPAAPAAGPSPACTQFQACCNAVSALPNMSSLAATCAAAPQWISLGAAAEPSCTGGLNTLRSLVAALPGPHPAACGN